MKSIFTRCFIVLVSLCGCSFQNDKITKLKRPDTNILQAFNITGQYNIVYQFYQEYKTTEKVRHMIAIVKMHGKTYEFQDKLPICRKKLKQLTKIEKSKFLDGRPIMYTPERILNEDIRTTALEYGPDKKYKVFHSNGYYQIISDNDMEAILICDTKNDLMYIEAVR
jgi:hypothetical protein